MSRIYHIVREPQWQAATQTGGYRGDTLDTEGFIHCSSREQVLDTANRFFRGAPDLVLLEIDEGLLRSPVRYEPGGEESLFPHIYGPLNLDAVVRILPFPSQPDGTFVFPDETGPVRG